jgi:hypothetical protein
MKKVPHWTHYAIDEELAKDLKEVLKCIMLILLICQQSKS